MRSLRVNFGPAVSERSIAEFEAEFGAEFFWGATAGVRPSFPLPSTTSTNSSLTAGYQSPRTPHESRAQQPRRGPRQSLVQSLAGNADVAFAFAVVLWPLSLPFLPLVIGWHGAHCALVNLGFVLANPADGTSTAPGVRAYRLRVFVFHHAPSCMFLASLAAAAVVLSNPLETPAWHMVCMQALVSIVIVLQRRFSFVVRVRGVRLIGVAYVTSPTVTPVLMPSYPLRYALCTADWLRMPRGAIYQVITEAGYTAMQRAIVDAGWPPAQLLPPLAAVRASCPDGVLRLPGRSSVILCRPAGWSAASAAGVPHEMAEIQRAGRVGVDFTLAGTFLSTSSTTYFSFVGGVFRRITAAALVAAAVPFIVRRLLLGPGSVLGDTAAEGVAFVCFAVSDVLAAITLHDAASCCPDRAASIPHEYVSTRKLIPIRQEARARTRL